MSTQASKEVKPPKEFRPPGAFIKHLEQFDLMRRRPTTEDGAFEIHYVDLTPMKLNVGYFSPFLVPKALSGHALVSAQQLEQLLPELQNQARSTDEILILVLGGKLDRVPERLVQRIGKHGIAVVDRPVMESIYEVEDRTAAWKLLAKPLVRFLGRGALSPYVPGRPAFGGRFFGRSESLTRLTGGKTGGNFTVVGNRRIGKTSLLREVKQLLMRENQKLRTADIYGSKCNSSFDVMYEMLEHLRPDLAHKATEQPLITQNLPAHIAFVPEKQDYDVAVFIDELDHILDFDARQGYSLLHQLRATFEHERCRIFFAGFRTVMEAQRRQTTPLFNFTKLIPLRGLTRREANDMVVRPLDLLGIPVPEDLPRAIAQETGGLPELVQMCCDRIVGHSDEGNTPLSADSLLGELFGDDSVRDRVLGTFLTNANPYEQLLIFRLLQKAKAEGRPVEDIEFSTMDSDELLKMNGLNLAIHEHEALFFNLSASGVATTVDRGTRFRLAVPQLGRYIMAMNLDWAIGKAVDQLTTAEAVRPYSIWDEPWEKPDS